MRNEFLRFVGGMSFLPHMGEEMEDPFDYDDDYPFLYHTPDASEDDFEDFCLEDEEDEDCLDSLLRATQRASEERKARAACLFGISAGILSLAIIKFLQKQFKN